MLVELGNDFPTKVEYDGFTRVCALSIGSESTYVVAEPGARIQVGRTANGEPNHVELKSAQELADAVALHLGRAVDGITQLPDQVALLEVIGAWRGESTGAPTWVWSDNEDFEKLLGAFFECPVGRPDDVEATHHTAAGAPGVFPVDAEAAARVAVANEPTTAEE